MDVAMKICEGGQGDIQMRRKDLSAYSRLPTPDSPEAIRFFPARFAS